MEKDNKGITLVELLIAIAISAIIVGAATFFLMTAHKNYKEASASIDLQSETQILMEQMGTWIMEGNRVNAESVTVGAAKKDKLVIYQIPRTITATDKASKRVIWLSSSRKLYMKKFTGINDPDLDSTDIDTNADEVQENCIGEYVTGFVPSVDGAKVSISLEMTQSKESYQIQNDFKVRNTLR